MQQASGRAIARERAREILQFATTAIEEGRKEGRRAHALGCACKQGGRGALASSVVKQIWKRMGKFQWTPLALLFAPGRCNASARPGGGRARWWAGRRRDVSGLAPDGSNCEGVCGKREHLRTFADWPSARARSLNSLRLCLGSLT